MLALSKSDSSCSSSSLCRGENQSTHSPSAGIPAATPRERRSAAEQTPKDLHKPAWDHRPAAELLGAPPSPPKSTSQRSRDGGRVSTLPATTGRIHGAVSRGARKRGSLCYQIHVPARQSITADLDYHRSLKAITLHCSAQQQLVQFTAPPECNHRANLRARLKCVNQQAKPLTRGGLWVTPAACHPHWALGDPCRPRWAPGDPCRPR